MNLIDIFAVYQGDDDRSCGEPAFFYTNETVAEKKSIGTGWYGGKARVEKRQAVLINKKHYLIDNIGVIDLDGKDQFNKNELIKSAKKKLTKEELEALGL